MQGRSLISERWAPGRAFPWFRGSRQSMNFRLIFGNGSDPVSSHKRGLICCGMHQAVATRTCAKQLPRTCAILEAHAVIRDQVLIVGGMQQAMLISAMALLDSGEPVWMEDPGFHQARRVFTLAGAKVVPKPLDHEGIVIARSPREKHPKIIHITPSHQYPLGMTMSFERRTVLLDFARAHDAFVFEDDFYAEFRFTGPPLPCLQGIDDFGRVIYAGTMSKILFPSLRLGYIVAPEALIDPLVKIRSTMDQHSSAIDQATLARFITEGFFLSHIKRMRKIYAERREVFIKQFNELLGDRFTLQVPEGGLNMVAWLKREEDFPTISRITLQIGVKPSPLSFYCIRATPKPAFVFGFAGWTPAQIRESLLKLASSLGRAGIPQAVR